MSVPERQKPTRQTVQQTSASVTQETLSTSIQLSVQDGVLMAFGPEGDPVPPHLLKELCASSDGCTLRLKEGQDVDSQRALAVFDAQQRGALAGRENNRWVASFLGHEGSFEPTPQELLDREPNDELPPHPPSANMT